MEQTYRLSGGIQLPEGANFDNYQTPGNYYFTNSAIAGTMTNIPIFEAGVLKVEDSLGNGNSYMAQTYLPYARSAIFMRAKIYNLDGTYLWTSWLRYITTSDLESFGFPSTRIITDLHTIQQSCFFMYIAGAANAPLSDRGGIGICIYAGNAWRYLLVIPYNTIDMYVSTINSEGLWTTWTKK